MAWPLLLLAVAALGATLLAVLLLLVNGRAHAHARAHAPAPAAPSGCGGGGAACGGGGGAGGAPALDPVNDPAYNMRNVAKQSVLLEEHLVNDRKYCRDCCVKHFLHITGLVEEAVSLAGDRAASYPLLLEAAGAYNRLFERWLADPGSDAVRRDVAVGLRTLRKRITAEYFLRSG